MTQGSHSYHLNAYLIGYLSCWKVFSRVPSLSNDFPNICPSAMGTWDFSLSLRFPSVRCPFSALTIAVHALLLCLWKAPLYQILQEIMVALSVIGPCPPGHRGEHMTKKWSVTVPHLLSHSDLSEAVVFKTECAWRACKNTDCQASPRSFWFSWPRVGPENLGS